MGTYRCIRCTGEIEAKDKEEAIRRLDHSLGLSKGRPCAGGKHAPIEELSSKVTIAEPKAKAEKKAEKPKETKASEK